MTEYISTVENGTGMGMHSTIGIQEAPYILTGEPKKDLETTH